MRATGYEVRTSYPRRHPARDEILVIWNRYAHWDAIARDFEVAGATVLVAENGYIAADGSVPIYAIAKWRHNGAGEWPLPVHDRWSLFGVPVRPWRTAGNDILVLPQRGIGSSGVAMPSGWDVDIVRRLKKTTGRTVIVRPHPGRVKTDPTTQMRNVWAAVTWGSGAAIKALAAGVPVFHEMPNWIGAPAARFGIAHLEDRFLGDRDPMFQRLAWAQWRVAEIAAGEPFRWLLR